MSDREYVDVRDIHPDYQRAPCRIDGCDETRIVPTRALINRDYTLRGPRPDIRDVLAPHVEVRI